MRTGGSPGSARTLWHRLAALSLLCATSAVGVVIAAPAPPAHALDPVNPVTVEIGGHPANSGFLVFVEGDVRLNNDESEGTIAAGGNLHLFRNYQIAAGSVPTPTFTADPDTGPTYLYVGGGIVWGPGNYQVRVENDGFTKVLNTATYDAFTTDQNGATHPYRLVPKGSTYDNAPSYLEGRTLAQSVASISTPVSTAQLNIPAAFTRYDQLTQEMADCPTTVQLTDAQGVPLPQPIPPGSQGRLTLTAGMTNVLTLSATDLDNLSEIGFLNNITPTEDTPLLVNVTGTSFNGTTPNLPGAGSASAPYMLWNFPDMSSITVTGGDSLEGTIYAPGASVVWTPTQNIEGNVIAAQFTHGPTPGQPGQPREIHDFGFDTTISCAAEPQEALTLVKEVVLDDGGTAAATDWTLSADGPTDLDGITGTTAVTDVTVTPGDYTLAEADGPAGYTTDGWTCDGGTLNGDVLTLAADDDVTCTIINDDPEPPPPEAELTLVKEVVLDDGGTAAATDWTLSADGPTDLDGITGTTAVTDVTVTPGDYTLAEADGPAGYTTDGWTCDGGTLNGDVLTLAADDDVTCTITNDDPEPPPPEAELTLVKEVVLDDGGTAAATDWTLSADGPTDLDGITGTTAVTDVTVTPGDYTLAEADGPAGYTTDGWTCDSGTLNGDVLTLAADDDVTCTITNDDPEPPPPEAELTLVKEVVLDDGGTAAATDWTLSADGPTDLDGITGTTAVTDVTVTPGDYTLAEADGPAGYTTDGWTCDSGTLNGDVLTLAADDDVTCTIINDDPEPPPPEAELTLVKEVVLDDGGTAAATDWTLSADGPTDLDGITGTTAVTDVTVTPGDYTLAEADGPAGYTTDGWTCDSGTLNGDVLTLAADDDVTCTITNDDPEPPPPEAELTLVKEVVLDDGGTAAATDWTLSADGPTDLDGITGTTAVTDVTVTPGDYTLAEADGPAGYTTDGWTCDSGTLNGDVLTLAADDDVTCTIINDDPEPPPPEAELTLVKEVVLDDGGTAAATDWTLSADGPTDLDGVTGTTAVTDVTVTPGDYTLAEADGPAGYTTDGWTCDSGTLNGDVLTLAADDDVTCTITNDDPDASVGPDAAGPDGINPGSVDPGALPDTGGPSLLWLVVALAAFTAGTALFVSARRSPATRHGPSPPDTQRR